MCYIIFVPSTAESKLSGAPRRILAAFDHSTRRTIIVHDGSPGALRDATGIARAMSVSVQTPPLPRGQDAVFAAICEARKAMDVVVVVADLAHLHRFLPFYVRKRGWQRDFRIRNLAVGDLVCGDPATERLYLMQ